MNRWWGSSSDADKQAGDRAQRAARRTISKLPLLGADSDSGDDFKDCDLSNSFLLNLDGQDDDL